MKIDLEDLDRWLGGMKMKTSLKIKRLIKKFDRSIRKITNPASVRFEDERRELYRRIYGSRDKPASIQKY